MFHFDDLGGHLKTYMQLVVEHHAGQNLSSGDCVVRTDCSMLYSCCVTMY